MKRFILAASLATLCALPGSLYGQSKPTAIRQADLQVGAGFSTATSDYDPQRFFGAAFYTTLDLKPHLGGEFNIHQVNSRSGDLVYERTYEWGFRYHRTYGHFLPYARVMYGRGVFNFPTGEANLAYNMFVLGAGTDFQAAKRINIRVDYEYQSWRSFPPQGLTPQLLTIGAAYHFPGDLKQGKRYTK